MSKKRAYDSSTRKESAEHTRAAILEAARGLFVKHGYAGTKMPAIAETAGVALDTVYASVGKKPMLFRLLMETAISGTAQVVPALERDYVRELRAEPSAAKKLVMYARAIARIQPRLAPLVRVLQFAAQEDEGLSALWQTIAQRRAANMRGFAGELAATGDLRSDLSIDDIADILWSMNAAEYYLLLVEQRGWSNERFEKWLGDAWQRLLLK
ncbi:MAG: TetR/AcrR family transcriptional regulator [Polyangiaceae bacterium]